MQEVLICDDHSIIRRGLKSIIKTLGNKYSVHESNCIADSVTYINKQKPKFAIFDLQLGDGNMMEHLHHITATNPQLNVLVYSMCNEDIYGKRVLQIGAKGYLHKNADENEVTRALQCFFAGENYLSSRLNSILINNLRNKKSDANDNPFTQLSNREIEVTQQLLMGKSLKEISNEMKLHANTIVTYKNRIFEKLSVANIVELTNLARLYNIN